MIKTPKFWLEKNLFTFLLWPISLFYGFFSSAIMIFQDPEKISKKVICIGNLTLGGSGKTPVAMMIGKILREMNVEFAYLSRGYKGKEQKFVKIDNNSKATQTGDEPLLLSEIATTFVAKKRVLGAKNIEQMPEFQAIILDDGMQNNSLAEDFVILVIDGKIKFGNQMLFPAGPLRQSIASGFKNADLVIIVGKIDEELQQILTQNFDKDSSKIVTKAQIKAKNLDEFVGKNLIAFCGIAYPEKFFSYLEEQGLNIIERESFRDHYLYQDFELEILCKEAKKNNAKLITTKKDWVKFPQKFRDQISFLDIELEPENKELIANQLSKIFKK